MNVYTFNAAEARDNLIAAIREIAKRQGFEKVILGISGGKDSTVAAALCARALGPENVYGVMMPDGVQKDISDSQRVCEVLGIRKRTVNIGAMHDALRAVTDQVQCTAEEGEFSVAYHRESDLNVGPRLRMTTLRYMAQALNARLVGTGNLSEITVGYCTKDGDTSSDFSLLGALTSVEVVEVKTPSDGLSGKSGEERLGVTYQQIHAYIRFGTSGDEAADARIARLERAGMHKRSRPPVLDPFKA